MSMSKKPKSRSQAFWPVIGLVLALAIGFLSWAISPAAIDFLRGKLRNFPPSGVPYGTVQLIIAAILFVVLGALVSLVVAAAVPKKKSVVTEKALMKEREEMVNAKKAQKIRQREINRRS